MKYEKQQMQCFKTIISLYNGNKTMLVFFINVTCNYCIYVSMKREKQQMQI